MNALSLFPYVIMKTQHKGPSACRNAQSKQTVYRFPFMLLRSLSYCRPANRGVIGNMLAFTWSVYYLERNDFMFLEMNAALN